MLAVGAGGGCLDIFFSRLSFLFSFSLSRGDGPIQTEILSQRAVKLKTTNQIPARKSMNPLIQITRFPTVTTSSSTLFTNTAIFVSGT